MRRIVLWASSTAAALVLLFGYHTSTSGVAAPAQQPIGSSLSTTSTTTTSGTGGTSGSTVTGDTVHTRWGPVQVQVTTDNGTITSVQVVQYPSENGKDVEINNYALPILVDETLAAQSADIDMVSGATVTSVGYTDSLQSALDQAGL
ncbi:FMN-binding protein [Nocardioides dilutus]